MSTGNKQVAIISTGVVGASWAFLCLLHGCRVRATDPAQGAEAKLVTYIKQCHQSCSVKEDIENLLGRLKWCQSVEDACRDVDFVQESGPERVDLKSDLIAQIDAAAPSSAVIASSSSGIYSSQFIGQCKHHPERILNGHPCAPPHLIPVVEICPGSHTSPQAVQAARQHYVALDRKPIVIQRELTGFILNRLQAALWREAFHLVLSGACTVADVDASISHGPGLRWALLGPMASLSVQGGGSGEGFKHFLDHLGPAMTTWWNDHGLIDLTDENKAQLQAAFGDSYRDVDWSARIAQRDEALMALLRDKESRSMLP